jgi:hypothetical protein
LEAYTSRTGYLKVTADFIRGQYPACTFVEKVRGGNWRLYSWESILDRASYIDAEKRKRNELERHTTETEEQGLE